MKKTGMLNSSISKVLSDLGHTDWIVIGDAGLPIPDGIPKIDLALTIGVPDFVSVVRAVHADMVVEKIFAAEEMEKNNPHQQEFLEKEFPNLIEYIPHEAFKQMTSKVKAFIRTGEATPYSNCILQAGVIF
ncbi:D-ribose pyranase [Heyndrickxia acidicola]|uniref:D-ribose pyranase n=1 Tax=Heyndrickxia acidicola TaxID=209389 RepID=A0ABU6MN20_9BACI|nr:D-ribose pyranase [Heyndrickxia acidicola]MED1205709.1 D-ribose pyranase [Heyndrickxia acidicola]